MDAYGITSGGIASESSAHGFEGKNILEFVGDMDQRPASAEARRKLFEAREKRVHPGLDDVQLARLRQLPSNAPDSVGSIAKVLTSWNGLMLAAFAEAARALNRDDYREVAQRNAEFLLRELRQENGRLLHSWKEGDTRFNGYLESVMHFQA